MYNSCDPVNCSLPGSSVHGFLQARILEWVAISYSRGSSQLRDRTRVSCSSGNAGVFFTAEPVFPLFLSVQFSHSVVSDSATPWITARQASLSTTNTQSSPKRVSIVSVMPSNHLILCRPLLLLPSIFPSIRVFPVSQLFAWGGQSIKLQHQSFQWTPGLISFRMDWLDLLAVQGTLKSLLQHHSSKASVLECSVFFIVQLSHPYMTTGKTTALTTWTFVGKVMSLLFNMVSRLVIAFLPKSKYLLISWLQSPSAVILEPKK